MQRNCNILESEVKNMKIIKPLALSLCMLTAMATSATTAYADSAAEMAKKLQNPLANIKAVMTDNTIGFNTGTDEGTSYGFQIQPVYAIDYPEHGFTFIPRAVIPITGLEPGTKTRFTGENGNPIPTGSERVWGLGDSIVQFFFAPLRRFIFYRPSPASERLNVIFEETLPASENKCNSYIIRPKGKEDTPTSVRRHIHRNSVLPEHKVDKHALKAPRSPDAHPQCTPRRMFANNCSTCYKFIPPSSG